MKNAIIAIALSVASFSATAAEVLSMEQEAALFGTIIVQEQCAKVDPANAATYEQLKEILPRILVQEGINVLEHTDKMTKYSTIASVTPDSLLQSACSVALRLKKSSGL